MPDPLAAVFAIQCSCSLDYEDYEDLVFRNEAVIVLSTKIELISCLLT